METHQFLLPDDGSIPNNPRLPMIVHTRAFERPASGENIRRVEKVMQANGWAPAWHNSIYPFPHYHAICHEALFIAQGWARVRFGGRHGVTLKVDAGDVAILPAGTGHQALAISDDLLVIGAYPQGSAYDLCRGSVAEYEAARAQIATVPIPAKDPVSPTPAASRRFGAPIGRRTIKGYAAREPSANAMLEPQPSWRRVISLSSQDEHHPVSTADLDVG